MLQYGMINFNYQIDPILYQISNIMSIFIVARNKIVWKLLKLLQDFLASARLRRVYKRLLPKSAIHYSYELKPNNIIGQRKTTDIEKLFYAHFILFIWLKILCKANTCKYQTFAVHIVHLLHKLAESHIMLGTNC